MLDTFEALLLGEIPKREWEKLVLLSIWNELLRVFSFKKKKRWLLSAFITNFLFFSDGIQK